MSTKDVLKAKFRDAYAPLPAMRKDGYVPGVVFGKDFKGLNIMVAKTELAKFFHHSGKVFEVEVEGNGKHLVALDEVQRGYLGTEFTHFSFHKVNAKEKTIVTLPIHFVGETKASKDGGVVYPVIHEVDVKGLPKDFPEYVEINVASLGMNDHWTFEDIKPPMGCTWACDMHDTVVSCHLPKVKVVAETVETEIEVAAEVAPVTEKEAA